MLVEISCRVIQRLRDWNNDRENISFDRSYVLALLLVLTSKDDISKSNINQSVIQFIRDLMLFRTSCQSRVNSTEKYILDYCKEQAQQLPTSLATNANDNWFVTILRFSYRYIYINIQVYISVVMFWNFFIYFRISIDLINSF